NYILSKTSATTTGSITAKAIGTGDFDVDTEDETYTGSAITKTITSSLTEGTDYTVSYSENVNAGTATITITGNGNYSDELTYTFTINKADQTLVPESYSVTKTYGDADFVNGVTGAMTTLYYTSWETDVATVASDGAVTIVGVGTTNIAVFAFGDSNYNGDSFIYTLTVEQATPVVSLTGVESKTYDGTAVSDPTVSVTLVNGDTDYTQTITYYAVADDGTETELTDAPSAVGSYKVVVTVDAGSNYVVTSTEAYFSIQEAEQSVTIEGFTDVIYDGQPHEVTVTADADATVTVTYTDASGNTVAAPVDVGTYTAHVTVTMDNYATFEQDVVVSIVQAAQDISYDATSVTKTEGDDAFTNPLTQTTVVGEITYTSSDETVATVDANGQVTIVGAGTAIITATAAATDNYTEATASYTLTVEAAKEDETEEDEAVEDDDSDSSSSSSTSSGSSSSKSSSSSSTSPKTGDESKVALWLTLTITAAFGLLATAIYSRKKNDEQ
ncbi:MAG: MBG domain-containing protein, partial [Clostridiales bacterium]|nr:MBG domain-containing protein [Clostridiales bacterium]